MRISIVLCGVLALMAGSQSSTCLLQQSEATGQLIVLVTDTDGKSIPNATASVYRWTGKMEPLGLEVVTDGNGRGQISAFPAGDMFYIGIRAADFASTHQTIELNANEDRALTVILAKPVSCWIQVNQADGMPVEGAEFQRLDFVDSNDKQVVVTEDTVRSLNTSLTTSDQTGKLRLPPIPDGAKVTAWIAHSDWKLAKLEGLVARVGEVHSVKLQRGVPVQLSLVCEGVDAAEIEGDRVDVMLFPSDGGSSHESTVLRSIEIQDGRIAFAAHPVNYSSFKVSHERYFITPEFENSVRHPNAQLDMRSQAEFKATVMVRPRVKAAGRIVDPSGLPLAKVSVYSTVSNIGPTNQSDLAKPSEWASGSSAETDAEGYFELDVAPGTAEIETIHMGYFSNPVSYRFMAAATGVTELPPFVLSPVPALRGQVLSESHQPVKGAIAKMRSTGYGDADPIVLTDENGRFELPLSRIPYRADGEGLQTDVYVLAIDPNTGEAGIAAVDLTDGTAVNEISVPILTRDPDWALKPLPDQPGPVESDAELAARRKLHTDQVERFSAGQRGETPPDLSDGTWLNSPARSLKDLKGKFVLLDFWFIGCGPCHRDLPSVKVTYEAFRDRGFTVVSVHDKSQSPDAVEKFAKEHGMTFPIVVDNSNGTLLDQYSTLGVYGFPSYILLGPDGKILVNDCMGDPDTLRLRSYKTEVVFHALQTGK